MKIFLKIEKQCIFIIVYSFIYTTCTAVKVTVHKFSDPRQRSYPGPAIELLLSVSFRVNCLQSAQLIILINISHFIRLLTLFNRK